jgi:hypothetical protein
METSLEYSKARQCRKDQPGNSKPKKSVNSYAIQSLFIIQIGKKKDLVEKRDRRLYVM